MGELFISNSHPLPHGKFKNFASAFGGEFSLAPNYAVEQKREEVNYHHSLAGLVSRAAAYGKRPSANCISLHVDAKGALGFRVKFSFATGDIWFSPKEPHVLLRASGFGSAARDEKAFEAVKLSITRFTASTEEGHDRLTASHLLGQQYCPQY